MVHMRFPSYEQLQARNTMKWTRYGADVIPLWVAESDFETCPAIRTAVQKAVDAESFGYPAEDHAGLATATADFYQDHYDYAANPEWVHPVADVVRALLISIQHFTTPDSPVIVPVPAYPPFFQLLQATGRQGIFVESFDLAELRAAFEQGAGCLLLCNPYNPLGYIFSREELVAITDLAAEFGARVLVDEIHAPLIYDGKQHVVAAGVSDTAARMCITVTATSKAWNTAGLKCAQIIFSNAADNAVWNRLSNATKDGASILGLAAAEAAYRDGREFLQEELAYLQDNRDYLLQALPEAIPGVKIAAPQATYLMWLDLNETAIPGNKSAYLLEHAKVALNDGAWFGEIGAGCARLNFATSREILEQAVARIAAAVAAIPS